MAGDGMTGDLQCKGCYALGTACGQCSKCARERAERGIPDGYIGRWPPPTLRDQARDLRLLAAQQRRTMADYAAKIATLAIDADLADARAAKLEAGDRAAND